MIGKSVGEYSLSAYLKDLDRVVAHAPSMLARHPEVAEFCQAKLDAAVEALKQAVLEAAQPADHSASAIDADDHKPAANDEPPPPVKPSRGIFALIVYCYLAYHPAARKIDLHDHFTRMNFDVGDLNTFSIRVSRLNGPSVKGVEPAPRRVAWTSKAKNPTLSLTSSGEQYFHSMLCGCEHNLISTGEVDGFLPTLAKEFPAVMEQAKQLRLARTQQNAEAVNNQQPTSRSA